MKILIFGNVLNFMEMIMWYVNQLLCYTAERRDEMVQFYISQGQRADVKPVPQDSRGGYILPINDPMEQ